MDYADGNGVCLPEWENRLTVFSADNSCHRRDTRRWLDLCGMRYGFLSAAVFVAWPDGVRPASLPTGLAEFLVLCLVGVWLWHALALELNSMKGP